MAQSNDRQMNAGRKSFSRFCLCFLHSPIVLRAHLKWKFMWSHLSFFAFYLAPEIKFKQVQCDASYLNFFSRILHILFWMWKDEIYWLIPVSKTVFLLLKVARRNCLNKNENTLEKCILMQKLWFNVYLIRLCILFVFYIFFILWYFF